MNTLNTSLPSEFSPISLSSYFYILPLPSAYTYCNAGSNERDPLFCPSYIVQHKHSINTVFVYPLPLNQSSCDNIAIISYSQKILYPLLCSIFMIWPLILYLCACGVCLLWECVHGEGVMWICCAWSPRYQCLLSWMSFTELEAHRLSQTDV